MPTAPTLHPTPWRTCRVLANPTRLAILRLLFQRPGQSVSTVAERLKLKLSLTSQYLRALEARGLLSAERKGRRVLYRPIASDHRTATAGLVVGLRRALKQGGNATDAIYRQTTAFTHPRRVEIYRLLDKRPHTTEELLASTNVSTWALQRHLRKLESRGFVASLGSSHAVVPRSDPLGKVLELFVTRQ